MGLSEEVGVGGEKPDEGTERITISGITPWRPGMHVWAEKGEPAADAPVIDDPVVAEEIDAAVQLARVDYDSFLRLRAARKAEDAARRAKFRKESGRARKAARWAGWEPQEKFPGSYSKPWKCQHVACGKTSSIVLFKKRTLKCSYCAHALFRAQQAARIAQKARRRDRLATKAEETLWEAWYDPLEEYPLNVNIPWLALCLACGSSGHIRLRNLRNGYIPLWDSCRNLRRKRSVVARGRD